MSVVGIDFGDLNTVIAVARNKGIDVIANEVSNRLTPSLVCFAGKARHLGESAKSLEIQHASNTVGCLKRLLGILFEDPLVEEEKEFLSSELVKAANGQVAVRLSPPENDAFTSNEAEFPRGEDGKIQLSMVQVVAMYFVKLRDIAEAALARKVSDVVISVPVYYTEPQRRAILDAATIANLNVLRLLNETTASALAYGIPKTDLPEGEDVKPRYVCLVDIGESQCQVAIVAFAKGKLEVKGIGYDRSLGGRNFDACMVNHFAEQFNKKYRLDIFSNHKALYRLRVACEKAKKILSANSKAVLSVESIMNDVDVSSEALRIDMEAIWQPLLDRLENPLSMALSQSGLLKEDLFSVELVGGCTRIPAIREKLATFFGQEPCSTLNQDEAIARGCAFQCAILSPTFRVKDFAVTELCPYSIHLSWDVISEDPEDKEVILFPAGNTIPSTKLLSFERRKHDFTIQARYNDAYGPLISTHTINNVSSMTPNALIKVKVRLNPNSILTVDLASWFQEEPDATTIEGEPKMRYAKKGDLPIRSVTSSLDLATVNSLCELEIEMATADKLIADTENAKNSLEEYIYETRSKLESSLAEFVETAPKEAFLQELSKMETWLYEDGCDETKSTYLANLDHLKKIGNPIMDRKLEFETYQYQAGKYVNECNSLLTQLSSVESKYNHISMEERTILIQRVSGQQKQVQEAAQYRSQIPKYFTVKPATKELHGFDRTSDLKASLDSLIVAVNTLMNKPKPKVQPPAGSTPSQEATPEPTPSSPEQDGSSDQPNFEINEMDLD